jgi:hypothetical protein
MPALLPLSRCAQASTKQVVGCDTFDRVGPQKRLDGVLGWAVVVLHGIVGTACAKHRCEQETRHEVVRHPRMLGRSG